MTMQLQDHVRTYSYLRPAHELSKEYIDEKVNAAVDAALSAAVAELGREIELNVRSLLPDDFGVSTNTWLETTAGSTWADSTFADGSQIPDNRFIGIYGARWIFSELSDGEQGGFNPNVTALRMTIGGSRVAQWDLVGIFRAQMSAGTPATAYGSWADFPTGIAVSPVSITQNKAFTVSFLERTTTVDFAVQLLGVAVEPVGSGAGLNP